MRTEQMIKRAYRLRGRVQGVGFRWWAQRTARSLGLRGWVRNCADGTVEIVLAGAKDAVGEMVSRLREGPGSAQVRSLEEMGAPDSVPSGFEIAH